MKQTICAFALLTLAAMAMHAQNSVTMTLNIDHADRVTVKYLDASYNDVIVDNLQDGDNTLTVPVGYYSKSVDIIAKEGFGLESCTYLNPGATEAEPSAIQYMTRSYFDASLDPSTEGAVWTVKTFDFAEKRTAHATFNIDDPSKAMVKRVNSNTIVELDAGDNQVSFIPAEGETANESVFSITSTDPERPLYKVLVNGQNAEGYDNENSYVTINDNDIVTIEAEYPDINVPVRFTYSDTAYGFVTKIAADGTELDFDGNSVEVKCGSKVEFWYDENNYNLTSISINGEPVSYPWSPISLGIVTSETVIDIDAAKVGNYKFNVNVNDAGYVKLLAFEEGASIYYGGQEIPLTSGENKDVEVSDKRHFFSIEAKTRSKLVGLTLNGNKIEQVEKTDYSGNPYMEWPFPIEINDGDVLDITASGPVRDNDAVIYVDKIPEGSYSFDFNMNGYNPGLKEGYNIVKFDDNEDSEVGDLPFNLHLLYSPMASWLYMNGEAVEPASHSENSDNYTLPAVEGNSVLKIFTQSEPQTYAITFTATGIADEKISVKKDYISAIKEPEKGFDILGTTAISIIISDLSSAEVTADGVAVQPQEDGSYVIVADAPTDIEVKGDDAGVTSGSITESCNKVYNLQGICLNRNADSGYMKTLPAGIYIINGKKVKI